VVLSFDAHSPCLRVDRRPDAETEIELEMSGLFVGMNRLTKASLERPLTDELDVETKTAEEVGQVMRVREVADLVFDTARCSSKRRRSATPRFPKSMCAAKLVKVRPSPLESGPRGAELG
jgi:hypothetical protein